MFTRDGRLPLKRLGISILLLCAATLAVENTVLLAVIVGLKPLAFLAAAGAILRVAAALVVPIGIIAIAAILGWWLPLQQAREHGESVRAGGPRG
jgi:hypothetical protein